MADVFVSYARANEGAARRIAQALRSSGFEVWSDEQLPAHRAYSEIIEQRLEQAKAVVVLWSKQAAGSQWVRAEADYARNAGKLVQALLDDQLPPLPFNQIQCANLKGWRGSTSHSGWRKLVESVSELVSGTAPQREEGEQRVRRTAPRHAWLALAAAVLIAAALFLVPRLLGRGVAARPVVAVLPFQSLDARDAGLVAGIWEDTRQALSRNPQLLVLGPHTSQELAEQDARAAVKAADYLVEANVRSAGDRLRVSANLTRTKDGAQLWSQSFDRRLDDVFRLQSEIASETATDRRNRRKLVSQTNGGPFSRRAAPAAAFQRSDAQQCQGSSQVAQVSEEPPVLIPSDPAATVVAAEAGSPWRLSLRDAKQVLKRIWLMWGFHNLSLLAGGVAFFAFLALTPLIAAIVMLYGLIAEVSTVERQIAALAGLIPADAASVLKSQLLQVVTTSSSVTGIGLVVALGISIYGAMYAANGLIAALNVINTELESRGVIALTRRAVFLTLAAVMIGLTGLISGGVFAWLTTFASQWLGDLAAIFKAAAWISAFVLGTWGFALIMRYGPDRRPAKWRWLTPGAIVATALWMASSFGFSLYVAFVTNYSTTYGSLSAVVVFLLWLYFSAYGALLGALVNAELERQTAADSTEGPDRPLGERGAVVADTVVTDSLTDVYLAKRKRRQADRLAANAGGAPRLPRDLFSRRRRREPE